MSKKKFILAVLPVVSLALLAIAGKMKDHKKACAVKAASIATGVLPRVLKIFS